MFPLVGGLLVLLHLGILPKRSGAEDDIDDLIDEIYNEMRPVILPKRENTRVFYSFIYLFILSFFFGWRRNKTRANAFDERDGRL